MNLERFCIKFFTRPETTIDEAIFIDIFHEWIRRKKLGGILFDVADYRHVPDGPGVMLITHEINFAMDWADERLGLSAQRKLGQGTTNPERILELARATAAFGTLLEADARAAGKLKLEGGGFHFMANDRLAAPNTDAGFAALQPDLAAAVAMIYPARDISLTRVQNDPRGRLTIAVESGTQVDLQALF
jgi:hypothetical protein